MDDVRDVLLNHSTLMEIQATMNDNLISLGVPKIKSPTSSETHVFFWKANGLGVWGSSVFSDPHMIHWTPIEPVRAMAKLLGFAEAVSLSLKFDNGKSVISVGRSFASEQFLLRKLDYQMLIYRYLQYINLPIIWGRCLTMLHFWEFRSSSTNRWITNEKKQLGDLRSPGRI